MTQHNHRRAAATSAIAFLALLAILSACSSESELRFSDSFVQDHNFSVELNSDGDGLDISFNAQNDESIRYQLARTSESGCLVDTCADYLAFTMTDYSAFTTATKAIYTDSLPTDTYYYELEISFPGISEKLFAQYPPTGILPTDFTATAGDSQVTLSWTPYSDDITYNIYRSSDPDCALANYTSCADNALFTSKSSPFVDDGLTNGTTYYYWIEALVDGVIYRGDGFVSAVLEVIITGILNDTGIDWGGDYSSGNNSDCSSNVSAPQDCDQGRDATEDDDSDGHAGFSFTKLDSSGNALAASATEWSCVLDNITGLIWEVKTDDGGLRDKDDTYNWYNSDPATNGGAVGSAGDDGDICYGYDSSDASTYCNTEAFTARVNAVGLCGANNWRMPDQNELHSIIDYSRHDPSIDLGYFPNTRSHTYWSSSPSVYSSDDAWLLNFSDSRLSGTSRSYDALVRLVSTKQ